MNQEDLRVIRSKKLIREAFIDLIEEKGYKNITVKDISKRAMINRKTFYHHYENIDALYSDILNMTLELIFVNLSEDDMESRSPGSAEKVYKAIRVFLHNLSENKRLISIFFHDISSYELIRQLDEQLKSFFESIALYHKEKVSVIPVELLSSSVSALVTVVIKWYIENSDTYTEEDAAKIFMELISKELITGHNLRQSMPEAVPSPEFPCRS